MFEHNCIDKKIYKFIQTKFFSRDSIDDSMKVYGDFEICKFFLIGELQRERQLPSCLCNSVYKGR